MSTFGKITVSIVVIAILAFGVWFMTSKKSTYVAPVTTITPTPTPTPVAVQPDTTGGITTRDNTDASLNSDMSTVDSSIIVVDQNRATSDKSFNDKPVTQTE